MYLQTGAPRDTVQADLIAKAANRCPADPKPADMGSSGRTQPNPTVLAGRNFDCFKDPLESKKPPGKVFKDWAKHRPKPTESPAGHLRGLPRPEAARQAELDGERAALRDGAWQTDASTHARKKEVDPALFEGGTIRGPDPQGGVLLLRRAPASVDQTTSRSSARRRASGW